ncbi:hypothetical protein FACS1894137_18520 [Spirochaetia bacterium]|nr:hypothetical protein FACS1894137_18520 [Spirochaetia bacterium]
MVDDPPSPYPEAPQAIKLMDQRLKKNNLKPTLGSETVSPVVSE